MKPNIKTFRLFFLGALFCCSAVSCKKLLEISPNPSDKISADQAFADSTNVVSVLAGIYNNFGIADNTFPTFLNGGITIYTGLSADELINLSIEEQEQNTPLYTNSVLPNNFAINVLWADAYKPLYNINAAIIGVASSSGLTAVQKKRFTGELKTVRAFYYFHLVNLFGPVPLVTGVDFRANARLPRSPVDDVYGQIIKDLEEANTSLEPGYPSDGRARPNLYIAKTLLAKVHLYRKNWQKAVDLADEVVNSGIYTLEADLNNIFLAGSTEAIWQIPLENYFFETVEAYHFVPELGFIPNFDMTPELLNAFETGDQRKISWVAEYENNGIYFYHPFKYKNKFSGSFGPEEDLMLFRVSEIHLIRAEALAQVDRHADALIDINLLRSRAGLPDLSFTDKETLLADIMQERRIELFAEWGNRWYDLKRTNMADPVLGASKPDWQPHDAVYPIPLNQIITNPFLVQNPGY
jgi:hypothetical protein